jgi:hypothetical protein
MRDFGQYEIHGLVPRSKTVHKLYSTDNKSGFRCQKPLDFSAPGEELLVAHADAVDSRCRRGPWIDQFHHALSISCFAPIPHLGERQGTTTVANRLKNREGHRDRRKSDSGRASRVPLGAVARRLSS